MTAGFAQPAATPCRHVIHVELAQPSPDETISLQPGFFLSGRLEMALFQRLSVVCFRPGDESRGMSVTYEEIANEIAPNRPACLAAA